VSAPTELDPPLAALLGVFAAAPGGGNVAGVVVSERPLPEARDERSGA